MLSKVGLYSFVVVLVILSLFAGEVEVRKAPWECHSSECSIYAYGCPEPWVYVGKKVCFAEEVSVSLASFKPEFFKLMYETICCKVSSSIG